MYSDFATFQAVTQDANLSNTRFPLGWELHEGMYGKVTDLYNSKGYGFLSGVSIARLLSPFVGIGEGFSVLLLRIEVAVRTILYGLTQIFSARSEGKNCFMLGFTCLFSVFPKRVVEVFYAPFEAVILAVVTTAGMLYSPKEWTEFNEEMGE